MTSTETVYGVNGTRTTTVISPDNSFIVSAYSQGRLISVTQYDNQPQPNQIGATTYEYDSHGRRWKVTDARNGTTTYNYNEADLVAWVSTPPPGGGKAAQITRTYYNKMLQATNIVQPDGASLVNEYWPTGKIKRTYGARTYPVGYGYDYAGRLKYMTNWSNFASSSGRRVTSWNYHPDRGWLSSKRDPDVTSGNIGATGTDYTYTSGGRLRTRTWARIGTGGQRVTTSYAYGFDGASKHGDITGVSYLFDPQNTPALTFTYDRLGRQKTVTRSSDGMTATISYNLAGQVTGELFSSGLLNAWNVGLGYDTKLRRNQLQLKLGSTVKLQHDYEYDNASRLKKVSDSTTATTYSATYSRLANSPAVDQILFKTGAADKMLTTKSFDSLKRLTRISSTPVGAAVAASAAYEHNDSGQRVRMELSDGTYWIYEYDSLGQVKGGKKYWSDGSPVAGQQFEYDFDDIGNRTVARTGGDENGANLRTSTYVNNLGNQLVSRSVPGFVDIKGVALATSTVTVDNSAPYRRAEYYRKELNVANSSPVWKYVPITASGENPVAGHIFIPKNPELFDDPQTPSNEGYDLDGNQLRDGRWNYTWDAENRLIQMTANTSVGPQLTIIFEYDWKGRRIRKQVLDPFNPPIDIRFLYDEWNMIAEIDAASSIVRRFMWGNDISDSTQGAGGVGGLLSIYDASSTTQLFVAHDGNGNITLLLNANSGQIAGGYEYGPFGEVIRATGPMAKRNPFRFSGKFQDDETDLIYYGHRYYNPSLGRWISRDPLEEHGALNLYGFVGNDAMSLIDVLGMGEYAEGSAPPPPSNSLDPTTWNSWTGSQLPSEIEQIWRRANLTAFGGSIVQWPDAAAHLRHFLGNSGATYTIRFKNMNRESKGARNHYYQELYDAMVAAERLTLRKTKVEMVTIREVGGNNLEGNWLYAVGRYRTWAKGSVERNCDDYKMVWSFNFRDVYDWALNNGLGGGLVTDREMAILHRAGRAREYEMVGEHKIVVKWKEGQRYGFGASVSE